VCALLLLLLLVLLLYLCFVVAEEGQAALAHTRGHVAVRQLQAAQHSK
jgi:hypothetical protein